MKLKFFALLLVAFLLAGCGNKTESPASTGTPVATKTAVNIPDFTVYDANGKPVMLSDYFGKPIVLNFWASWCGPCKSEMPAFQKVYTELGSDVHFLMVNVGEHMDEASAFIASTDYTFPVYYDVNNSAAYAYQVSSIPATFFINAEGNLVTYQIGTMEESNLRAAIGQIKN